MNNLSEDEIKVIVNILGQLNYKYVDAKLVVPIVDKLRSQIKEPDLDIPNKPEVADKDKEKTDTVIS